MSGDRPRPQRSAEGSGPGLSRRSLIHLAGRTGGVAGALSLLAALELMPTPSAYAGSPRPTPGAGAGKRVVIVGAGIAGLVAAYELTRSGFDCVILEASDRIGGRVLTLRAGDEVAEEKNRLIVRWPADEHLYFDAGASRISHRHEATLGYCRRFGVAIRPFISDNRSAYLHDEHVADGAAVRVGRVAADARGYVAELLAKLAEPAELEAMVGVEDVERLREFLRLFGGLARSGNYRGSPRAGFRRLPGVGDDIGELEPPLALRDLLASRLWQETITVPELFDHASPMFEVVGGMDHLVRAFLPHVPPITLNVRCTRLERVGDARVRIHFSEAKGPRTGIVEADYALVCIPLSLLRSVENDFRSEWRQAIAEVGYTPAVRIGLYAKSRFWERDGIYGGQSWTTQDISQIWYPSSELLGSDGVFVGGYAWDDAADRLSAMGPDERVRVAVAQGAKLHPSLGRHVREGAAVAWKNLPFARGAWGKWPDMARRRLFPTLSEIDGPYLLAGEHVSNLPGWQEGAVRSAQHAVALMVDKNMKEKG